MINRVVVTNAGIGRRVVRRAVATLGAVGLLLGAAPARAAVSAIPDRTATFDGAVWATAYSGNTIYVGGDFTHAIVGGKLYARSRLAAIDATSGALLNWAPTADAQVRALTVSGGSVYAAGLFSYVNGSKRDSLAKLNGSTGALYSTFKHSISGKPYALAAGSGRLYLGGAITAVNGQGRVRLAAFNLSSGALDTAWKPTADDQVEALVATSGRIYVGGRFHKINGVLGTDRLTAVSPSSGAVDMAFRPRPTYITRAIAVTSTGVYGAHGGQGGRAVSYSLSGDVRWTLTMDGDPQAIGVLNGTVYVGGHFDNVCRSSRTGDQGVCLDGAIRRVKLVAAGPDGAVLPWTANANGVEGVLTMAVNPGLGKVAAGGAFTMINNVSQKRFVQFG